MCTFLKGINRIRKVVHSDFELAKPNPFNGTLEGRVFANGPGDRRSLPDHVIPKTLKMVLDTSLFNTQQFKECIKSKVEQSWERGRALPYTSV